MKKFISILLFIFMFALSLTGCSTADNPAAHQEGNLIITNYSSDEITDITISHLDETVSISSEPIKDTQICGFSIEPATDYVYTVSFVDHNGEEHSQEFTNSFTEDIQILIAIQNSDSVWTIDYDKMVSGRLTTIN